MQKLHFLYKVPLLLVYIYRTWCIDKTGEITHVKRAYFIFCTEFHFAGIFNKFH